MNPPVIAPPPLPAERVPTSAKTLRQLFLTLFLRGRGIRGMNKEGAPKSVGRKLALTLSLYFLFGGLAIFFFGQPGFALAIYLHAMTFVFLGMFVASSAGEVLFNKEEADILLHRPVVPRVMLWAKIRVLVEVSLWLAFALNAVGLVVGIAASGHWQFPIVHLLSTALEALFCTGCVVLVYQLCLRWFGRERLEGLMTIAQVIVSIAVVLAGQILPQLVMRVGKVLNVSEVSWWIHFLPPAWFAGFDDAFSGSSTPGSWLLAGMAVGVTTLVMWLAFGRLAHSYETGLQVLNETVSSNATKQMGRRWADRLISVPPFSWWLRDPVTRASFLLTTAYLFRDRDVKLRVYPSIAPILIIPFIFLLRDGKDSGASFGVPFSGVYLGMVPLWGSQLLQYSQQFQASDIFRAAPLAGPGALCHGARRAVLVILTLPLMVGVVAIVWFLRRDLSELALLLPGIIALPIFSLIPGNLGHGLPLSQPPDAAKSASRGLNLVVIMMLSLGLAQAASWAWSLGFFWPLVLGEAIFVIVFWPVLHRRLTKISWQTSE